MDRTERGFWLRAPGEGEIRPIVLPRPAPDDVVVRTPYSGVSRGTDTLVFRGGVPSQFTVMRAPFRSLKLLADEGEAIKLSAFDALITDERYFEDLPRLMPRLAGGELSALCVRVVYGQG